MRIKLDENLPLRLARILAPLGHETDTVPQEGLAGQDDDHVWQTTQTVGRFFITQDKVRVRSPKQQNDPNKG